MKLWRLMFLTITGFLPSAAQADYLSATNNPCTVASGQTQCTAYLSWDASQPQVQVWVSVSGGPEALFGCGHPVSSLAVPWISLGPTYTFKMYASADCVTPANAAHGSSPLTAPVVVTAQDASCSSRNAPGASCRSGFYCDPSGVCQTLPSVSVNITQPISGAPFSVGQSPRFQGVSDSTDKTFLSKTGLVITKDGNSVCQGQGWNCDSGTLPPFTLADIGSHNIQGVSYVLDIEGYLKVGESAVVPMTVGNAVPHCASRTDCGAGFYCDPSAVCQPLSPVSVNITQPSYGASFRLGQSTQFQGNSTSPNNAFLSKVGLVITMDGSNVCAGQGWNCNTALGNGPHTFTNVIEIGSHTIQGTAYVQDIQGYLPVGQSISVPIDVTATLIPMHITQSGLSSQWDLTSHALTNPLPAGTAAANIVIVTNQVATCTLWGGVPLDPVGPNMYGITINNLQNGTGLSGSPTSYPISCDASRTTDNVTLSIAVNCPAGQLPDGSGGCRLNPLGSYVPQQIAAPTNQKEMLGIADWGGLYQTNPALPRIVDGAQQIQAMGSQTIFLALGSNYPTSYPNSNFGAGINSMTDLVSSPPFQQVFKMHFKTYVLAAFSFSNTNYLGSPNLAAEYSEMYQLAVYLLQNPDLNGSTVVVKGWEGDNAFALQTCGNYDPGCEPTPVTAQNMTNWINQRQQAIVDARHNVGATSVQVLQAVEFNFLSRTRAGKRSVLRDVVPNVATDLISYSAYESINVPTASLQQTINNDLAYIRSYPGVNNRQLMVAEFGWPENQPGFTDSNTRAATASQEFFNNHVARASYWGIFDNAMRADGTYSGYGLIRSDGTRSPAYTMLRSIIGGSAAVSASFAASAGPMTTGSLMQMNVSAPVQQVEWTITGTGNASSSANSFGAKAFASGGGSVVHYTTPGTELSFTPLGLGPGTYHVLAIATDASGNISAMAETDVTLVAPAANTIRVYPNPWKVTTAINNYVTFDGLTGHTTIKIFTVSGYSVQTLTTDNASVRWDLRTRDGDNAASGIYLYSITNNLNQHTRGKFVLIR